MQRHCWLMPLPEEVYLLLLNTSNELCFQNVWVQYKQQTTSMPTKIQVTSIVYINTSLSCPSIIKMLRHLWQSMLRTSDTVFLIEGPTQDHLATFTCLEIGDGWLLHVFFSFLFVFFFPLFFFFFNPVRYCPVSFKNFRKWWAKKLFL